LGSGNNAGNLAHVLHGIVEQHQVHLGVHFVVLAESVSQFGSEIVHLGELVVQLFIKALHEVGKSERLRDGLCEVLAQVEFGERLLDDFSSKVSVLG